MIADDTLSQRDWCEGFLKAECLQKSGSASRFAVLTTRSRSFTDEEKRRGVVAASAGNHAQGVALAATLNGIKSTIVLPEIAPLTKIIATQEFGGEVVLHGATFDEAVAYSRELQAAHGYTYVHAFDDEAGHRRTGNYRARDRREHLPDVSTVVVPIGGGGIDLGHCDRDQRL